MTFRHRFYTCIAAIWLTAGALLTSSLAQQTPASEAESLVRLLFAPPALVRNDALRRMEERGETDVVPGLIWYLRRGYYLDGALRTLRTLTGADPGPRWKDWMLWQEAHPEVKAFEGFDGFIADRMARIDPNFRLFLKRGVKHEIRLEEITWGGVLKDGIPALIDPKLIDPKDADYLTPKELVFGISINGDARAYPLRFLDWHEMFNDVIGGKPVSLAYCTLCGSGILFETALKGRKKPFLFGSSGFLYRSNKLMYDTQTNSLWNQFTGRPVVGPLTGSGIELNILPVVITRWDEWFKAHPDTKVLSSDTGYLRDYAPGNPYGAYFASPALMFPALVRDRRLEPKDYIYAVRALEADGTWAEKAWALTIFNGFKVVNDRIGAQAVVLIGDAASRTVRAYKSAALTFVGDADRRDRVHAGGVAWTVTETALVAADGRTADRLPGHIAYWFAWQGYKPAAEFAADAPPR